MTYRKFIWLPIFLILGWLGGCVLPRTEPKFIECPIPKQDCNSSIWNGIPYDTSAEVTKNLDYYYVFEPVRQLNSPDDEWCLSFISKNIAAITFTDRSQQRVMIVRMVTENRASLESGIGIPIDGSSGALSFRDKDVAFAAASADGLLGNSDIYTGALSGNLILDVKNLGDSIHFDVSTWESQPTLSPYGNVLFYVSDYQTDLHGTDIWFSIKLPTGQWSTPINCGEALNSPCDELSPFVTNDGSKLLFASAGHETNGGYDIFESNISDEFWLAARRYDLPALRTLQNLFSKAKNLGTPLNTSGDELFPSSPADADSILYYSSNQAAEEASLVLMKGGFDIYVRYKVASPLLAERLKKKNIAEGFAPDVKDVYTTPKKIPEPDISPTYKVEGTVYNATTNEPVPNADVTVREKPEMSVYKETQADNVGYYQVELEKNREFEIIAQARDLFFDSFSLRVDPLDTVKVIKHDFKVPVKMTLRVNFPTDEYDNPYKYVLDSNGIETNRTWIEEIRTLAENIIASKDKLEKIVLIGHTDDVGTVEYNQQLGQRRVDFIVGQLVKLGVPKELLEARSGGELEPLPQKPGETLKMFRKRLRRVEMEKYLKS